MLRHALRASIALGLACGGGGGGPEPLPDAGPLACPTEAPTIGTAGTTSSETFPLAWGADGVALVDLVVPDDLTALALVAQDGTEYTAFWSVRQDNRGLVDLDTDPDGLRAPFYHTWNYSSSLVFPTNEDSALEPGCLRVEALTDGSGAAPGVLHVLSRRRAAGGTLRVDLVLVGATELPGATLDQVAAELATVLDATGLAITVEVATAAVDGDPFPPSDGAETLTLRGSYRPADASRIPIYVIQGFTGELDTLGIAGGIPGANGVPGAASAGVLVAVDPHLTEGGEVDVLVLAETAAHELGHQLGLFHTTEAEGTEHDPIGDTAECDVSRDEDGDGEVSAEECAETGGQNLMFWVSAEFPQRELSAWQRRILELGPVVR
ncbi:MAG: hypothetical protein H6721_15085 [Sandaracinus sp.]|nr:hypothetical protein [Sandaracinus sp.]MCB9633438.1 hypothetical protein [Sandaracinus sp.]